MIPRGTFQCPLCEDRYHAKHKKEVFKSYFPKDKISICEYCYDDYRNSPEYEHLRPDIDPSEKEKIKRAREYYGEDHIYF